MQKKQHTDSMSMNKLRQPYKKMKVLKEVLSEQDYKDTKDLLYQIRTEHSYKQYDFFRRILYVAAHFGGKNGYIRYSAMLSKVKEFSIRPKDNRNIMHFCDFNLRLGATDEAKFFGTKINTILNGTWGELMEETIEERKNMLAKEYPDQYILYVGED